MGKKTQSTKARDIHLRKFNLRKQQYTQVYLCVYGYKFYTKGMVYSSEKAEAVTSGLGVDNNCA